MNTSGFSRFTTDALYPNHYTIVDTARLHIYIYTEVLTYIAQHRLTETELIISQLFTPFRTLTLAMTIRTHVLLSQAILACVPASDNGH